MDNLALLVLDLECLSLEKRVPEASRIPHKKVSIYKRRHNCKRKRNAVYGSPHHKRLCTTPQLPCLVQLSVEESAPLRMAARLRTARPGALQLYRRDYINGQRITMKDLPDAVLTCIMAECSLPDVKSFSRACRRMRDIVNDHRRSAALVELHHRYNEISKYAPGLDTGDWTSAVELRDYLDEISAVARKMIREHDNEILAVRENDEHFPENDQELAARLQNMFDSEIPCLEVTYHTLKLSDSWRTWTQQAALIICTVCSSIFDSEPHARHFLENAPTLAILLL